MTLKDLKPNCYGQHLSEVDQYMQQPSASSTNQCRPRSSRTRECSCRRWSSCFYSRARCADNQVAFSILWGCSTNLAGSSMRSSRLSWFVRSVEAFRLRGPLSGDPAAEVLQILLLSLCACLALDLVLVQPRTPAVLPNASVLILGAISYGTALLLLRNGLLRRASLFYLVGTWLMWTVVIVWNGGIHSVGLVFYVAIPISAAWLLGFRAVVASGIICLASALVLAVLEIQGVRMPRTFPGTPIGIWVGLLTAITIGAVPAARILYTLRDALAKSQERAAELRESEVRFRIVADTAPVMIWMSGLDKLCTFFNKQWLEFTGRTMEQEVGNGWLDGVHPEDVDRCLATYSSSFDAQRSFAMEYRLRHNEGEYRWIVDNGTPRYKEGEFVGYIGSCIDITDAKRAQEQSVARQKLESLGTLASGIAHDFNNLLGAVLAQTELAMAELAAGSRPYDELKAVRDVAVRGSDIVRQMMIYAGKESGVLEPVDISKVIAGMLVLLKVVVSGKATLVTNLSETLPAVQARTAQVNQIVMNLIVNASEALRDRDGVIRVTTEQVTLDSREALAKALPAGDYVKLQVSDTGCGMSSATQAMVFDPFFTTKFAGRGLGLAVVHGTVRSLRGAIDVASEPGRGTTFEVLLPCAEAGAKPDADRIVLAEEFPPAAPRPTVLIVEDEEQLRLAVAKMLRESGMEVFEASNGSAAIDSLRASGGEIDLLLLDLTIPGISSQEVIAEIALNRPDVKIILTSAYSAEVAKQMVDSVMISGFIRKPFRFGELIQTLRNALVP